MSTPAEAFLLTLPRFAAQGAAAYQPGLARMEALLEAMGQPHTAYPSIHVAGTNGKGSTASLTAALATAAGLRVGLHTSPHLWHVGERLRLDGRPAPPAWLDAAVARYRPLFEQVQPSFFEATVALSLCYFAEAAVDLAVVEVGLGGRLDATNVLRPRLAVITGIGLDHTDLLGTTHAEIAREKAGIIKPGVPVLVGPTGPAAHAEIAARAAALEAPLYEAAPPAPSGVAARPGGLTLALQTPVRHYEALHVGLGGAHQAVNAALAVRAAELAVPEAGDAAIRRGLADVRRLAGLRARLEVIGEAPCVVMDVAHNPDGLAAALAAVRQGLTGHLHVGFGTQRDKDVEAMVRLLAQAEAVVWPVVLAGERALPSEALQALLAQHGLVARPPGTAPAVWAAFRAEASPADALLLTGSHQVVAQLPASAGREVAKILQ